MAASERIGVLAVMDAEIKSLPQIARLMEMAADCEVSVDSAVQRLTIARAAVAELIEKADALVTAARVLAVTDEPERWRAHVQLHADIVTAALARVQGEGA